MSHDLIPLNSDTETRPIPAMRRAIADAEVGDEQQGRDPTVNRLHQRVAELLGKDAALWLPSGTWTKNVSASRSAANGRRVDRS